MPVSIEDVSRLREATGVGILKCKQALERAGGDFEKAVRILREEGLSTAVKKEGRRAAEGVVASYIHAGGKLGVLVEVNCETDFVARNDVFQALVKDITMHVAASDPRWRTREDVPPEVVEQERAIYRAQAERDKKPPPVTERIVEGRIEKFYAQTCLYEQPFVKDPEMTVSELIRTKVAAIGENIVVRRFIRFKLGETLSEDAAPAK
ncbi:MAG: translation elongation factor Ts [Acidobacteriota bacterium]|nr:MAG: translation elongation factor Ts [Acidobacteriota bacterium]